MLRQPPIHAALVAMPGAASNSASAPHMTSCGVAQIGGNLALVLTLDGVTLCLLPQGVCAERDVEAALV